MRIGSRPITCSEQSEYQRAVIALRTRIKDVDFRLASLIVALLLVVLYLSLATDRFLTAENLINISRQIAVMAIVAAGVTIVIISGGIDLSVGGIVAIAGTASAALMASSGNVPLAFAAAIAVGSAAGAVNGFLIAYLGLIPFAVTLATLSLWRSLNLAYTNGSPLPTTSPDYEFIGQGYVGPLPTQVVLFIGLYILGSIVMRHTRLGHYAYALGSNELAARYSGVDVARYRFVIYTLGGTLCGLGGIVLTARLGSAQPTAGTGLELDAIAAVILGGASLYGGRGTLLGTLLGCFLIGIIGNGMNLLNIDPFYQGAVKGGVVLMAILLDRVLPGTAR